MGEILCRRYCRENTAGQFCVKDTVGKIFWGEYCVKDTVGEYCGDNLG